MSNRVVSAVSLLALALPGVGQTLLGPAPYLSAADSPFPLGSAAFAFEDFEDHVLDVPGVVGNGLVTSTMFSGAIIDSVDGDDGVLGNPPCAGCDSYFVNGGTLTFTFDAGPIGGLPRQVGVVWTDGGAGCTVTFEAFDSADVSLGTLVAPGLGDSSNFGTHGEDRFFGIDFAGGVKRIAITNSSGGIEVDHLQYELRCGVTAGSTYCTAKTSSAGCVPQIGWSGCPSVSSPAPFLVTCDSVIAQKSGLLFYGFAPNAAPFQGGFLCVQPPTRRTALQSSGGTPSTCDGQFAFDMNAHAQSGADANLVSGATVYAQYWYRDPASASTTGLSDGLGFVLAP